MRILFFSDVHFRLYGSILSWNVVDEDGVTKELKRAIRSMEWLNQTVEYYRPDLVVCLGDIFHTLYSIDSPVVVATHGTFKKLHQVCLGLGIPLWVIPGNHDYYKRGVYSCAEVPSDEVFLFPMITEYKGIKFGIVPYFDPESDMQIEIANLADKSDFILTHATFSGAKLNNYKAADFGIQVNCDIPIISGHIHVPQEIGNVLYVGSLYQIMPSEYSPHGIILYDTDTLSYEFVENTSVKSIVILNSENYELIFDLDPDRYFIKADLSDDIYAELKCTLDEFEHLLFRTSRRRQEEQNSEIDVSILEPPEVVIDEILKQNYPDLFDIYRNLN